MMRSDNEEPDNEEPRQTDDDEEENGKTPFIEKLKVETVCHLITFTNFGKLSFLLKLNLWGMKL